MPNIHGGPANFQSGDKVTHFMDIDNSTSDRQTLALERLRANPRVSKIRLIVAHDACPACCELEGSYDKKNVPPLPVHSCSHPKGCRCFYQPWLEEIYP
jgi:hypothetical protein